jgi:transcriptional regulator with XRE-family HTH domain
MVRSRPFWPKHCRSCTRTSSISARVARHGEIADEDASAGRPVVPRGTIPSGPTRRAPNRPGSPSPTAAPLSPSAHPSERPTGHVLNPGGGKSRASEKQRRLELGGFLTTRRRRLERAEFGLPSTGRKTRGLRREELAYLAGVSYTWYTWLEQARDINPSRHVVDAVAQAMRLSAAEHRYVLSLVGFSAAGNAEPAPRTGQAHVLSLLDSLAGLPAYAIAPDWQILGWTSAFAALYPNVAAVPEADRNMLWLLFTDPYMRELIAEWEIVSHLLLATFRAEAAPRLAEPRFSRLVERLSRASDSFRTGWERHNIEGFASRKRLLRHPVVGDLHLDEQRLTFSDGPRLHVVIYTPVQATDARDRLCRLLDTEAERGT